MGGNACWVFLFCPPSGPYFHKQQMRVPNERRPSTPQDVTLTRMLACLPACRPGCLPACPLARLASGVRRQGRVLSDALVTRSPRHEAKGKPVGRRKHFPCRTVKSTFPAKLGTILLLIARRKHALLAGNSARGLPGGDKCCGWHLCILRERTSNLRGT